MLEDLACRVAVLADRRGLPETPTPLGYGGLSLVRARAPTPLQDTLYAPLLCLVLQGAKETMFGASAVRFGQGESLIVSVTLPTVSRVVEATPDAPYVSLADEIDLRLLRAVKAQAGQAEPDEGAEAVVSRASGADLADALRRLFDLHDAPASERHVMTPLIQREIHFRMLGEAHGGMLRRLARPDSHESRIDAVIGLLHREPTRNVSVEQMAEKAGMSRSAFHEHFKAVTRTTPLQFQKNLRLLAARERLASTGDGVGQVAFAVGYESPTQFSREYARKFGHPPSREPRGL